jgi:hypothetical protein
MSAVMYQTTDSEISWYHTIIIFASVLHMWKQLLLPSRTFTNWRWDRGRSIQNVALPSTGCGEHDNQECFHTAEDMCTVSGKETCSHIMQNKLFRFEHKHTSQSESHFYSFCSIRFSYLHFYTLIIHCELLYQLDVCGSVLHSTIHKEKSDKMQQCIKILLFHIYMKLNMFWVTHCPSSGA